MNELTIEPIKSVRGEVKLAGSKSISNRALLMAALSAGETTLSNLLAAEDVEHMLSALTQLGVSINFSSDRSQCTVTGLAGPFRTGSSTALYLGNAGTAVRPLCSVLAAGYGEFLLDGDARMRERPIGDLVDALRPLGADIAYTETAGYLPVRITSQGLKGGETRIDCSLSSQYLTALLMAAPLAERDVTITIQSTLVSKPYIDITLAMLKRFGIECTHRDYKQFHIDAPQTYTAPGHYWIEGDASSASYFLAAAAIKGGAVKVHGIGRSSMQGDVQFAIALEDMGAKVKIGESFVEVERGSLHGVDLDLNHIPDAAMTLAVVALFAEGKTRIRNIYNWRVKESDRITAMATELTKVGATVLAGEDYIEITPPEKWHHARIETYNDHRMAMCFSLVALGPQAVTILDPGCTAKTFPDYFEMFSSIAVT
ncbi:3-phosphoshikimate 1-carboxyvinyltransferase [Exilibacterium tricleocarpae]|uniref:3-phosphoshikimate 1-carboxyvinyltransferase n=1 Tax=Exilibacterium tricleocarpae TaxID=2591008 RepID=A0A545T695_9GAMM|nr:3-phosphoshikimate 1-carboxyvinyltransferase [Exilibacterium tricleocarpae]TQV72708.1 3-phosphoshikimate 1-carboxyvinyltransferase [Exilibacterium tricleocarpae]